MCFDYQLRVLHFQSIIDSNSPKIEYCVWHTAHTLGKTRSVLVILVSLFCLCKPVKGCSWRHDGRTRSCEVKYSTYIRLRSSEQKWWPWHWCHEYMDEQTQAGKSPLAWQPIVLLFSLCSAQQRASTACSIRSISSMLPHELKKGAMQKFLNPPILMFQLQDVMKARTSTSQSSGHLKRVIPLRFLWLTQWDATSGGFAWETEGSSLVFDVLEPFPGKYRDGGRAAPEQLDWAVQGCSGPSWMGAAPKVNKVGERAKVTKPAARKEKKKR